MNIGYLLSDFPPLTETFIRREVQGLADLGHNVTVYTHQRHYDPLVADLSGPRLAVREIHYLWNSDLPRLYAQIRADGIEHLHSSLTVAAHLATHVAARRLNLPFSLTAYSGYEIFTARDPNLYREISNDPLCEGIVVEDGFMRNWLAERLGANPNRLVTIANAFDLERYRLDAPRPVRERVVILAIARFVFKKGLIHLVRAFHPLSQLYPRAELWLVGRGPEELKLRGAAARHPRIHFLGAVTEARTRELYAEADILCLPCVREPGGDADGIPTVVLEGMAFELPVVSSNLLSTPEYITDGQEGYLTGPGDEAALTAALAKLCADPDLRAAMGKAGRARVEQTCDLQKNLRRLESVMLGKRESQTGASQPGANQAPAMPAGITAQPEPALAPDPSANLRAEPQAEPPGKLVSIAITAFNREKYLRACIDSVLAQTYRPIEVVVVDDGSTDATRAIIAGYGDAIKEVYHEQNRGIPAAKNTALRSTSPSAKYVGILDSDDILLPAFVERCVGYLDGHAEVGLVYTDNQLIDAAGRHFGTQQALEPWTVDGWLSTRNLRGDTWLARRDLVMQTRLHDERMRLDEDYDLFYQLLQITTFGHLREALMAVRFHQEHSSSDALELAKCHAANLVRYGYSPEYAFLRARRNPEWILAIEEGIRLGKQMRAEQ